MTTQFSDRVEYRDQSWVLAWANGAGLFSPHQHGIEPAASCSACWHGYVCVYRVADRQLLLDRLALNLDGPPPVLFGVRPDPDRSKVPLFSAMYHDLGHPVHFSGGLLLGRERPDWPRPLLGMHPAWRYREVHELVFAGGELTETTDCSAQLAAIRQEFAGRRLSPDDRAACEELFRRIASCFRHPYSHWRDPNDPNELLAIRNAMAEMAQSSPRGPGRSWSLATLLGNLIRRKR